MIARLRRVTDPGVLEFDVGGDVSLYPDGSERAVVLNATASEIWRLTERAPSVADVVAEIARAYGQDPESVRGDVERTIGTLVAQGLLSIEGT